MKIINFDDYCNHAVFKISQLEEFGNLETSSVINALGIGRSTAWINILEEDLGDL